MSRIIKSILFAVVINVNIGKVPVAWGGFLSSAPRMLSQGTAAVFEEPTDGNYTLWLADFDRQLRTVCIDGMITEFNSAGRRSSSVLLSLFNGLGDVKGYKSLVDLMANHDGGVGDYIKTKGPYLAFIVIGLLSMLGLIPIFLYWSDKRRMKSWTAGIHKNRHKTVVWQKPWTFVFGVTFILVLLPFFGISSIVVASNFDKGIQATLCDTYLTNKGFFFGSAVSNADAVGVSNNWKGGHVVWDQLEALRAESDPTTNPHLTYVLSHQNNKYLPDARRILGSAKLSVDGAQAYIMGLSAMLHSVVLAVDISPRTAMLFQNVEPLNDLLQRYGEHLEHVLWKCQYELPAQVIDYLGSDATGLNEVQELSLFGLDSTNVINDLFAQVTRGVYDRTQHYATAYALVLALFYTWGTLSLVLFICGMLAYGMLFSDDRREEKKTTRLHSSSLLCVFIAAVVFGSISCIIAGVYFFLGDIGKDVCYFSETELLQNGQWQLLNPPWISEDSIETVDLKNLLSTCAQEGGSGDVPSTLGLTKMAEDIEKTLYNQEYSFKAKSAATMMFPVEDILVNELTLIMQRLPINLWPSREGDETNYLAQDLSDINVNVGTRYPVPRSLWASVDPPRNTCATSAAAEYLNAAPRPVTTCLDGLTETGINLSTLETVINKKSKLLAPTAATSTICLASLAADPNHTQSCPTSGAVTIDSSWNADGLRNSYVLAIFSEIASVSEKAKWLDAVNSAIDIEKLNAYSIVAADHPNFNCPNGVATCTLQSVLQDADAVMLHHSNMLNTNLELLKTATDEYLNYAIEQYDTMAHNAQALLRMTNCQFVGTSLRKGALVGICEATLPSMAYLALANAIFYAVLTVVAVLTIFNWTYVKNHMYLRKYEENFQRSFSGSSIDEDGVVVNRDASSVGDASSVSASVVAPGSVVASVAAAVDAPATDALRNRGATPFD